MCRISTEWQNPAGGAPALSYLRCSIAYQIWEYIEAGLLAYEHHVATVPNWLPVFCPTALAVINYRDRIRAAQFLFRHATRSPSLHPGAACLWAHPGARRQHGRRRELGARWPPLAL